MKKRAAPTRWHKLDNTANIFPVVASRRYSNVFRLTAVMREAVDPALLQQALEQTLPYFAAFNVRLRHGLFWNYLETNRATRSCPSRTPPAAISTPWRQAAFCSVCCITAAACIWRPSTCSRTARARCSF